MDEEEHLNEEPSVEGSGSLDEENKLEDQQKSCQPEEFVNSLPETTLGKKDVQVGFELTETVVVSEEVRQAVHAKNGCLPLMDGSPNGSLEIDRRGAKRARITVDEHQPSVHFVYNSLTRASKQNLQELLQQQWFEWHAKHVSSSNMEATK